MSETNSNKLHGLASILKRSSRDENIRVISDVLSEYTPIEIISEIARTEWDNPTRIIEIFANSELLPVSTKEVNAAAIYFHTLGIGGGERVTKIIAKTWKKMGMNSRILVDVMPADVKQKQNDVPCLEIADYQSITAENYRQRAESIAAAVKNNEIDCLVFAHWIARTLPFDLLLARLLGIRVYLYIQSSFTLFFLDADMPSDYIDIPLSYRLADGIICLSEMDKRFWSSFNRNVIRTNNPITLSPKSGLPPLNGHNIIWPARMHSDKSPDRVIPIMRELVKTVPDAKLYMIGPVDARYKEYFLELASRNNVKENIIICGPQSENEMIAWYEKCDAFLLTSRREGWSLALAEAQASGLPCLIYDLPYLTLSQSDGVISVPQDDYISAAKELESILTDKQRAQDLGRRGQAFIGKLDNTDPTLFWRKLFSQTGSALGSDDFEIQYMMARELMSSYRIHHQGEEHARLINHNTTSSLEEERNHLLQRIEMIENSKSFKIGRSLTFLPRKIMGMIKKR